MKPLWIFILFLSISYPVFSQVSQTTIDLDNLSDKISYEESKTNTLDGVYVEGTPYLNKEFTPGEVVINDSIKYHNIPLRYNIYTEKIQFLNAQNQIRVLDNLQQTYRFDFGNHAFTIRDYLGDEGKVKHGVLEVLADGHIQLYKKYQVDFEQATKAIGYKDAEPNRFVRQDDELLIAVGKAIPQKIRPNKKLLKKLALFKPNIEQYVKNHKLNPKSERDLIQLIQYCNN